MSTSPDCYYLGLTANPYSSLWTRGNSEHAMGQFILRRSSRVIFTPCSQAYINEFTGGRMWDFLNGSQLF